MIASDAQVNNMHAKKAGKADYKADLVTWCSEATATQAFFRAKSVVATKDLGNLGTAWHCWQLTAPANSPYLRQLSFNVFSDSLSAALILGCLNGQWEVRKYF